MNTGASLVLKQFGHIFMNSCLHAYTRVKSLTVDFLSLLCVTIANVDTHLQLCDDKNFVICNGFVYRGKL